MANPTNPQGVPGRNPNDVRNPNDMNERNLHGASSEASGRSDPSRASGASSDRPDSSRSSAQGSGEQGDLRDAIRELVQSIECLCGDGSKRDEPGARRHADQARRMAGQRGTASASRREPEDRDSERRA